MDNGKKVKGHKLGSPLCPWVQQKKYPRHPRFKNIEWEPSGSVVAKSKKPPFTKRGSDGKFVSSTKGKGKSSSVSHQKPVATVLAADQNGELDEDYVDLVMDDGSEKYQIIEVSSG